MQGFEVLFWVQRGIHTYIHTSVYIHVLIARFEQQVSVSDSPDSTMWWCAPFILHMQWRDKKKYSEQLDRLIFLVN